MELLIIAITIFLIFAIYIYKISYFYDYRYIGNVIRFIAIYYIFLNIDLAILRYCIKETEDDLMLFSIIIFVMCLITSILYRNYLVKKFGKEERFANSEEVDNIGNLEE